MRRSGTVAFSRAVLLLVLTMGQTQAVAQYDAYPPAGLYYYGTPEYMDRIGEVLDAIDSPSRRSDLAENWLEFSRSAITKNLELQENWVNLQRAQVRQNQQADQYRLEVARLQMQIEQLRAENLRLERENLQMRLQMNNQSAGAPAHGRTAGEPNNPAAGAAMGEPAPQMPPAGRQ